MLEICVVDFLELHQRAMGITWITNEGEFRCPVLVVEWLQGQGYELVSAKGHSLIFLR